MKTIKDFIKVRGWYSVSFAPSAEKAKRMSKEKHRGGAEEGTDTGLEDQLISEVEGSFRTLSTGLL